MNNKGFSLVELSIVLVILGLLTGGILAGQSLIRASELRAVSTQYSQISTAVQSFRDRYMALPGDMPNAQKFWGIAHATPATCVTTAGTGTQTCNGNGDGQIHPNTGSNESFRFWQHLANAGVMEGSYDGITHGATSSSSTTENSPVGKIGNSLWFTWNWGFAQSGGTVWFDGSYGNRLSIGGILADAEPAGPILKPEELWNIDVKMDDGKPAQGTVMTRWPTCTNAASSAALTAEYALTTTSQSCIVIFRNAF